MIFEERNAVLFDDEYSRSCIYFLINNKIVVYVGKTQNGKRRITQHKNDKRFDEIYIIKCDYDELMELEDYYMMKYKPKYNLLYNTTRKNVIKTYDELRKKVDITIIELIDYIKENNIIIEKFNNVESVKLIDHWKIKEHFIEKYK